jgi:hypothetical protein
LPYLWPYVNAGAVAADFEQRKAHRILAGEKGAAGEAAAVARDPAALPTTFDVEMVGRTDRLRNKTRHL